MHVLFLCGLKKDLNGKYCSEIAECYFLNTIWTVPMVKVLHLLEAKTSPVV